MIVLLQRKPRLLLVLILLVNLLLVSVQIQSSQGHRLIRSWSLFLFTPIAHTVHFVVNGVSNAVVRYVFLYRAQEENEKLRAENSRLGVELVQLQGIDSLLSTRAGDGVLEERGFLFDTYLAPVIWESAPFHAHRLVISGGTQQGVRKDDAVIVPEGIVGRIWAITPFNAEVELLTNDGAAAGAMVGDSRLQGIIQGDGSGMLRLEFIPNYESVEAGDIVYTSGTDQIYPKGYPIGRVVQSQKGSLADQEIQVEPFVDHLRLEEIMVVVSG